MKETGVEKINYIGHSAGFTQLYVSMMCFPKFYKKHLNLLVSFAGAAYVNFMEAPVKKLADVNCIRDLIKCLSPDIFNFQSTLCPCLMNFHAMSSFSMNSKLRGLESYP